MFYYSKFYLNFYLKKKSAILDSFLWSKLFQLSTRFAEDKDWFLVYRGTLDGFGAADFHRECDGVAKTVTIVKSTNGNIFGGYTDKLWLASPYAKQIPGDNSFIFSLVNEQNKPFIATAKKYVDAIWSNCDCGPCFGFIGTDIKIASDSNINTASSSTFGCSYEHQDYIYKTYEAKTILAGSNKFQTTEIEVFLIN